MTDEIADDRCNNDRSDVPEHVEQPDRRPAAKLLQAADQIGSESLPDRA